MTNYTPCAIRVAKRAEDESARFPQASYSVHLFLALVKERSGVAAKALANLGVDLQALRRQLEQRARRAGSSDDLLEVARLAYEEQKELGHDFINTGHSLLGLIQKAGGVACQVLEQVGVSREQLRRELLRIIDQESDCKPNVFSAFETEEPDTWIDALKSPEVRLRIWGAMRFSAAIEGIGPQGIESAIPALIEALNDSEITVRTCAADALGSLGPAAQQAIPALKEALKDQDEVRASALNALMRIGVTGLSAQMEEDRSLDNASPRLRVEAARVLWSEKRSENVLKTLLEALEDSDSMARGQAISTLEEMGRDAKEAVPALLGLLDDADQHVRWQTVMALCKIAPDDDRVLPRLLQMLLDESGLVRTTVESQLFLQTSDLKNALPCLRSAAKDPAPRIRECAVSLLSNLGVDAAPAKAELEKALEDSHMCVRVLAAGALWKIDGRKNLPLLLDALRSDDRSAAANAGGVLGTMAKEALEVVPVLHAALEDARSHVQLAAATALWGVEKDPARVLPVFLRLVREGKDEDRSCAISMLGALGSAARAAIPDLLEARNSGDFALGLFAKMALESIDPESFPAAKEPELPDVEACAVLPLPGHEAPQETVRSIFERRYSEGIERWTEAIQLNPRDAQAYALRSDIHQILGRFNEAIADLDEAVRIEPDDALTYQKRAAVYHGYGQFEKTIADCTTALQLCPQDGRAFALRALARAMFGELDLAIADGTAALQLEPNAYDAYNARAIAYKKKGEFAKAIDDYSEALRLNPRHAGILTNRSLAYKGTVDYAHALADAEEAIRIEPDSPTSQNHLAWTLATCTDAAFRNGPKAVEHARAACELCSHEEPGIVNTLAAALAEAGDFEQAVRYARQALDMVHTSSPRQVEEFAGHLRLYEAGRPFHE